jgi:cation transport ATPase
MVFNLGYNTALADGDAPEYGSVVYWALHGALLAAALGVLALLGGPLLGQLWRALRERRVSVEAMFVISAVGALVGSLISTLTGQGAVYYEVVAVVVCVYAIGKQISAYQRGRVGAALASLRDTFAYATVEDAAGGGRRRVAVGEVVGGTIVHIEPGDPVPVDGTIVDGSGFLREAAFTGEPGPVARQVGQRVLAGTWSLDASLRVRADAGGARSLDQLMGMVEQAASRPSTLQQEADAVMRWFVPVISGIALLTFGGWWMVGDIPWWRALFHSMAVLLVACPCAFGLATPAGIWAALYQLSQRGLTARNGQLVDALASCSDIVFDKTGTLTEMDFGAMAEWSGKLPIADTELAAAVASLSCHSQHPVNAGLAALSAQRLPVSDFRLHPGCGISGKVAGRQLQVGSCQWLRGCGISGVPGADTDAAAGAPKRVHVAVDGTYGGRWY